MQGIYFDKQNFDKQVHHTVTSFLNYLHSYLSKRKLSTCSGNDNSG